MKKINNVWKVGLLALIFVSNVVYGSEFANPIREIINYHKYGQDIYDDPIFNIIQKSKVKPEEPTTIGELIRYSIHKDIVPKKVIVSDKFDKKLVQKLIQIAKQYLGTPYRFGGTSKSGIDCSGFTMEVFKKIGVKLPRTASEQAHLGKLAINLKPGDLLFFKTYRKHHPGHVGIYIGHGLMIDASSYYGKVVIEPINQSYFKKHFLFAKSLF